MVSKHEGNKVNGEAVDDITYFVNTKAPRFRVDPLTGIGYWIPGEGHYETRRQVRPIVLSQWERHSNTTPGFMGKETKPTMLKANRFSYNREEISAHAKMRSWSVPSGTGNGPGAGSYNDTTVVSQNVLQFGFCNDPTPNLIQSMKGEAIAKLLENLRDSSINLAQAFAERKQTEGLIANTATKIAAALGNLRKKQFAEAARDLGVIPRKRARRRFNSEFDLDQEKAIGNAWLALQYGWKPLLADVYGAVEAIAKANNPRGNPNGLYFKATTSKKRTEEVLSVNKPSLGSGYSGYFNIIRKGIFDISVKVGVTFAAFSSALRVLSSVGITNPGLLAWELLPYSFVVDWFIPIGDYMASLDATNGLSFVDGYVTVLVKKKFETSSYRDYTGLSGYARGVGSSLEKKEVISCERVPLSAFPSAHLPSFQNPVSASHVASAMALLLQFKK